MKRLLLIIICLLGAAIYVVQPDKPVSRSVASVANEPRHLSSWGAYLSDLPRSEKPSEPFVAVRQLARPDPQQEISIRQEAGNEELAETAELPQVIPHAAKQSRPAKLVALNPAQKLAARSGPRQAKKLGAAKPASPTLSGRGRVNAERKVPAPVMLTDLDAKVSARGVKRRGLGLFLFGRGRHAAAQGAIGRD